MLATFTERIIDRARTPGSPQRPPWSLAEVVFRELCTGCGACIGACPEAILVSARGRLPVVDFARGGCTFCGACADACSEACFAPRPRRPAWALAATVTSACLETRGAACRVCESACATDAIRFRPRLGGGSSIAIDREACTGCGACVSPCPAGAIAMTGLQASGASA